MGFQLRTPGVNRGSYMVNLLAILDNEIRDLEYVPECLCVGVQVPCLKARTVVLLILTVIEASPYSPY